MPETSEANRGRAQRSGPRRRVLIAGAGVAALEVLLGLRARAGARVQLDVLAPGESFLYRPVAVSESFGPGEPPDFDLTAVLRDQRTTRHVDSLVAVESESATARTRSGAALHYDELIVAVGARAVPSLRGALPFRGRADVPALRELIRDFAERRIERVAFTLPEGHAWPLPMYELALTAAAGRAEPGVSLITAESTPLERFGERAGKAIGELLRTHGVRVHVGAEAVAFADRTLRLSGGATLPVDRVVALPRLLGPAIEGLPCDHEGFVLVDAFGCVDGVDGVYAAGDATAFPHKQGGLASAQADAIVDVIAARAGATVSPRPFSTVIRGLLLAGESPLYLRIGPGDQHTTADVVVSGPGARGRGRGWPANPLWWPPSRIAGRRLAPHLAAAPAPRGQRQTGAVALTLLLAECDAGAGDLVTALQTLESAQSLAGALPSRYVARRTAWLNALAANAVPSAKALC